jgi:hypothetical protein
LDKIEDHEPESIWELGHNRLREFIMKRPQLEEETQEDRQAINLRDKNSMLDTKATKRRRMNDVNKKSFTKRGGQSLLGKWEIKRPPVIMKMFWKLLEILADDLDISMTPIYLNHNVSCDREVMERELGDEPPRAPQISQPEKLRRELATHNQMVKERRREREENQRREEAKRTVQGNRTKGSSSGRGKSTKRSQQERASTECATKEGEQ